MLHNTRSNPNSCLPSTNMYIIVCSNHANFYFTNTVVQYFKTKKQVWPTHQQPEIKIICQHCWMLAFNHNLSVLPTFSRCEYLTDSILGRLVLVLSHKSAFRVKSYNDGQLNFNISSPVTLFYFSTRTFISINLT